MHNEQLQSIIERCRTAMNDHSDLIARHETNTRYTLIDPTLWALGWETWNPRQCELEYRPDGKSRVDYALFNRQGKHVIAVEAKRLGFIKHQNTSQLAMYADTMSEGMAVLTDGNIWRVYNLNNPSTNIESKLDTEITIMESTSSEAAQRLDKAINRSLWW